VDRLTKIVRLIPANRTDTAEKIADRLLTKWIAHGFGVPASIVSELSDRSLIYQVNYQQTGNQITALSRYQLMNAKIASVNYKSLSKLVDDIILKGKEEVLIRKP
jgi:hypothetical protein